MKNETIKILMLTLIPLILTISPLSGIDEVKLEAISNSSRAVMSVTTVRLDGSPSTGEITSFLWTQTAGTPVSLSSNTAKSPTFRSPGLTPGSSENLFFSLTVEDGKESSTTSVTITVLTWEQVDTGLNHTIALRSDGTLWAWGINFDGQIGQENNKNDYRNIITRIGGDYDWTAISAGDYHNLALKSDGTLWAWGKNRYRQIGNNTSGSTRVTIPTQIGTATNWIKINASVEQSFAINSEGDIYGWGRNNRDRLGLGGNADKIVSAPVKIRTGDSVSGGGISTLAIDNGALWGWGNNAYGQLAVPDTTYGSINAPDNSNQLSDIIAIACGGQHSYIIRRNVHGNGNDTLWSMGINNYGKLGTNDPGSENPVPEEIKVAGIISWKKVATGKDHGLAIGNNGTLWTWGYNNNGQLGLGNSGIENQKAVPEQVESDISWYDVTAWRFHSAGLKIDGTLWIWGASNYSAIGNPDVPTDSNNAVNIPFRVGY